MLTFAIEHRHRYVYHFFGGYDEAIRVCHDNVFEGAIGVENVTYLHSTHPSLLTFLDLVVPKVVHFGVCCQLYGNRGSNRGSHVVFLNVVQSFVVDFYVDSRALDVVGVYFDLKTC